MKGESSVCSQGCVVRSIHVGAGVGLYRLPARLTLAGCGEAADMVFVPAERVRSAWLLSRRKPKELMEIHFRKYGFPIEPSLPLFIACILDAIMVRA